MAFENVFDSSLIDYSKDTEQQDNKFYNDKIVDIVANRIKSGEDIPNTFYFNNFKIHSKEQEYCYPNNNYVLYDNETKICYATEIIEYTDNLYRWLEDEEVVENIEDAIFGNVHFLGMIIVRIPVLNNRFFVFFTDDMNYDWKNKNDSLSSWSNRIKDDNTIEFIEKYIKDNYNPVNLNSEYSGRFNLSTLSIRSSLEDMNDLT